METKGPIQSVSRAANILRCFYDHTELALQEISDLTDLHKSTAATLVTTLKNEGFLDQNKENSKYRLGVNCLVLGACTNISLQTITYPYLVELNKKYAETIIISSGIGSEVLYINVVESTHVLKTGIQSGTRRPFYTSASGKMIFANYSESRLEQILHNLKLMRFTEKTIDSVPELRKELEQIRREGIAFDDEEFEIGLRGVAAPVFDQNGRIITSVSISGLKSRMLEKEADGMIDDLKETANRMSQALIGAKYIAFEH